MIRKSLFLTIYYRCDPPVEWWQGSTFYEIFPASFQDSASFRTKGAGIGDLRGIIMRLDYLRELGVRTIRLNSIFPALHYPEYYSKISNITDVNENLGTLEDFSALVREIQKRNMSIVLDLPLYPFIKSLSNQAKENGTELIRNRRDAANNRIRELPILSSSVETIRDVVSSIPPLKEARREISSSIHSNQQEDPISEAIKFWQLKGVNGFYLQGLEHYVNEDTFVSSLIRWKSLLYPNNIFICHMKVLKNVSKEAKFLRNSILSRINLLDVTLHLTNSTKDIKSQIEEVTKDIVFNKPAYPWIHWSVGGVDTSRVASTINVKNASVAASLLSMMLPGTPSIFYGDEV